MKHPVRCLFALSFLIPICAGADAATGRPGAPGAATEVAVTTVLLDVSKVDGAGQSFTADLFVLLRWHDPSLAGADETVRHVDLDEIWHPALQIVNRRAVDTTFPDRAEVSPNGTVTVRQRYFGTFAEPLDLRDFPLDHQQFSIRLVVPGSSPDQVMLVADPAAASMNLGERSFSVADWAMGPVTSAASSFEVAPGSGQLSGWLVELSGHRHLGYWAGIALVSVAIIAAMSWVVFWLDPKYVPPRMSVAVTSMLTLIAYRFLLGANLPQLAYLTRMDYFLIGSTLLVLLTVVQVTITTGLVDRDQGARARCVNRTCRWLFPAAFVTLLAVIIWVI